MSGLQLTWLKKGERGGSARPLLKIDNLTVRVGVRCVLDGINMEVFAGDHVRITGPNGCGKSTLLNAIAGVAPVLIEYGCVWFEGVDITAWPAHERAKQGIVYMRQVDSVFPSLTVGENLMLALGQKGSSYFRARFPDWVETIPMSKLVGALSGGQRKKLAWGMTVLANAKLNMFDEPRAGVDHKTASCFVVNDKTILEIEHEKISAIT